MNKPNLSEGFRMAAWLFFGLSLLAVGSYAFGCWFFGSKKCGIVHGLNWILHHPDFTIMIPAATAFGFAVGAFGGIFAEAIPHGLKAWLSRHASAIGWIIIVVLVAVFLLWGIPDLYALRNS